MKKINVLLLSVFLLFSWGLMSREKKTSPVKHVKNVILMIGDGMGLAQVAGTRMQYIAADGKLNIEKMPVVGLVNTHSANALVTDSAASGTAIATGYKTHNGMISQLPDGRKIETIMEACLKRGMAAGLIATSRITHATPASFAAHNVSRKNEADIAVDIITCGPQVILGGGRDYFLPGTHPRSRRNDNRDLIREARDKGYLIVENETELASTDGPKVLGLFALAALENQAGIPSIAKMTRRGLELLKTHPGGFFLMVEGSQIDWECHENDEREMVEKIIAFDEAVGEAVRFADSHPGTLVIVTADHETGGMTINDGMLSGEKMDIGWSTRGHTAVSVPIYSTGAGAGLFTGWFDNTDIPKKINTLLGLENFLSGGCDSSQ